jgi:aminopeptidase N
LWLNEGFATLYEYYIPHLLWPEDGYDEDFRTSSLASALRNDLPTVSSSVPMSNYVETPSAIDGRFNYISYAKSGSVLKMFQESLSVDTFTKGVGHYLTKMSLKAAVPEDLFESMQAACDEDYPDNGLSVADIMGSWVYQAGYPIVSVARSGQNLVVSQHRYPTGAQVYSVPLSFATEASPDFGKKTAGLWLLNSSTTVPLSDLGLGTDEWIVFNVQQTGYYRMSYDSGLWASIAKGLRDDHSVFHYVNRRVLQDELNIGYSTLATLLASDVLEVQSYLEAEDRYLVWNDAGTVLR